MKQIHKALHQYTHSYKKLFSDKKGFTLIELLVVIGILGILAVSLVATINPFEQLKKAQDADVENTAVEFIDAATRYYTTHNQMMWNNTSDPTYTNCAGGSNPITANLNCGAMLGCLTELFNDGEIQAGFTTATGLLTSIIITGGSNSVTACFLPQSKAEQSNPNVKYNSDGTMTGVASTCPVSNPGGTTCYWCSE